MFLFLVSKCYIYIHHSYQISVQATVGSNITLECTVSESLYQWQKWLGTYWSNTFQDSSKYGNANTAFLTIYNIAIDDTGTYRSLYDNCFQTATNKSYCYRYVQ